MILNDNNFVEWKAALSKKLIEAFGKDTFTEADLTKDFYFDFNIKYNEFFRTEDGGINMDMFWSNELKKWLLSQK